MTSDDIERRLLEYGARWREQQRPPTSVGPDRIERKQHGTWVPAIAAAAAVVAIAGVAVVARNSVSTGPGGASPVGVVHRSGTVVPWKPLPLDGSQYTAARGVAAPPGTPRCNVGDLDPAVLDASLTATGTSVTRIALRHVGSRRCQLSAYEPIAQLLDGQGRSLGLPQSGKLVALTPDRLLVPPGDVVSTAVVWSAWCRDHSIEPVSLQVAFRGGQLAWLTVPGHVAIPRCDRRINGGLGGLSAEWVRIAPMGSVTSLVAKVDAPRAAQRGAPLDYVVELINPGDQPVALSPCPPYAHALTQLTRTLHARTTTQRYRLNCGDGPASIPPLTSVRFAMRLFVPVDMPVGAAELGWALGDRADSLYSPDAYLVQILAK